MDKFTAHIPDSQLQNLRHRIRDVRWPEDGKAAGARHGLPLSLMKKLTSYWYDYYDWKKAEDRINAYPNFLVDLSGYRTHFLQVKGQGSNPQPLILTHGWPGS